MRDEFCVIDLSAISVGDDAGIFSCARAHSLGCAAGGQLSLSRHYKPPYGHLSAADHGSGVFCGAKNRKNTGCVCLPSRQEPVGGAGETGAQAGMSERETAMAHAGADSGVWPADCAQIRQFCHRQRQCPSGTARGHGTGGLAFAAGHFLLYAASRRLPHRHIPREVRGRPAFFQIRALYLLVPPARAGAHQPLRRAGCPALRGPCL